MGLGASWSKTKEFAVGAYHINPITAPWRLLETVAETSITRNVDLWGSAEYVLWGGGGKALVHDTEERAKVLMDHGGMNPVAAGITGATGAVANAALAGIPNNVERFVETDDWEVKGDAASNVLFSVGMIALNHTPTGMKTWEFANEVASIPSRSDVSAPTPVRAGTIESAMPANTLDGSFTLLDRGFEGYPEYLPKPEGPMRIVSKAERDILREVANAENRSIRRGNPGLGGWDIHEIKPIKFGGSPVDPANKIPLPSYLHAKEVTPWWNELLRKLEPHTPQSDQ